MRNICLFTLVALAAPVHGSTSGGAASQFYVQPVDLLYPEIDITEDGWRGLLPVILLDTNDLAEAPTPAPSTDRGSE